MQNVLLSAMTGTVLERVLAASLILMQMSDQLL